MFGIATAPGSGAMSPADLKGRQVAISRATIIEYLLDRIMAAEGFGPDHVAKLEIKKIPVRLQMLLADQVPAALLPEPLLTLAELLTLALDVDLALKGEQHPDIGADLEGLGTVLWAAGHLEEAEETLARCLDLQQRIFTTDKFNKVINYMFCCSCLGI